MRGYIFKRNKTSWYVVIPLGRDPATGKYKQKWVRHNTRREAEAYLAQALAQLNGTGAVPSTKLKLREVFEQWLRDYAAGAVGPVTLATYRDMIRVRIMPALGEIPLQKLSPQTIQGYFSKRLREGAAPATVRHDGMLLHGALRHAVRWGLLARNPCDMVDPPRCTNTEMRVLDEEQVRLFLAEARRSSPHYSLYLMAVLTGMRQGELAGLRWRDVDFVLGVVAIQQTFYRLGAQQLFKEPKTSKARRNVALPKIVIEELRRLRKQQAEYRTLFGQEYEDHDLIFCQSTGRPLQANNIVRRDFKRILKKAGLPKIRFHDLRHVHASLLLKQGVHPKVVQERLGHATPAFTLQVYSHVLPSLQAEAAETLGMLLSGEGPSASQPSATSKVDA